MEIKYVCPFWGSDHLTASEFLEKALDTGYDGVEMNVPEDQAFSNELKELLSANNFVFIGQQWLPPKVESVSEYEHRLKANLERIADFNPIFINSHTGKDFFSFEENSKLLQLCESISAEQNVSIVHETHRGRFNHHTATTLQFIKAFPELKLNADFSHFCNVSESLLEDQEDILNQIIPNCHYIHARVGFDQSAQVNHPFAPEWKYNLDRFVSWWKKIILEAKNRGEETFYICPEFGPYPYIQQLPFTQKNTVDQWEVNVQMMEYLKETLSV